MNNENKFWNLNKQKQITIIKLEIQKHKLKILKFKSKTRKIKK